MSPFSPQYTRARAYWEAPAMQRPRIDRAIHAQLDRLAYLLRDVERSGGTDGWAHLWSHGHFPPTIRSAVRQGYLRPLATYRWTLTRDGRDYLRALDAVGLKN